MRLIVAESTDTGASFWVRDRRITSVETTLDGVGVRDGWVGSGEVAGTLQASEWLRIGYEARSARASSIHEVKLGTSLLGEASDVGFTGGAEVANTSHMRLLIAVLRGGVGGDKSGLVHCIKCDSVSCQAGPW